MASETTWVSESGNFVRAGARAEPVEESVAWPRRLVDAGAGAESSVDASGPEFYPFGEGLPPSLFFVSMRIQILFFASYRDLLGTGEMTLSLPEGMTVTGMVVELRGRGGAFGNLPSCPVVAVNEEYAPEDRVLVDGDVVAFIPPVAGG